MYKVLKEGLPPVNPEVSGGQHTKDNHHVMIGRILEDGPFHHHQLTLLEWCLDLE